MRRSARASPEGGPVGTKRLSVDTNRTWVRISRPQFAQTYGSRISSGDLNWGSMCSNRRCCIGTRSCSSPQLWHLALTGASWLGCWSDDLGASFPRRWRDPGSGGGPSNTRSSDCPTYCVGRLDPNQNRAIEPATPPRTPSAISYRPAGMSWTTTPAREPATARAPGAVGSSARSSSLPGFRMGRILARTWTVIKRRYRSRRPCSLTLRWNGTGGQGSATARDCAGAPLASRIPVWCCAGGLTCRREALKWEYGKPPKWVALGKDRLFSGQDADWEARWNPPQPHATATLWRYMSFAKFCSLLEREALFFSLVGKMADRYEGFVYPPEPRTDGDRLPKCGSHGPRLARKDCENRPGQLLDGVGARVEPHVGNLRRKGGSSSPNELRELASVDPLGCRAASHVRAGRLRRLPRAGSAKVGLGPAFPQADGVPRRGRSTRSPAGSTSQGLGTSKPIRKDRRSASIQTSRSREADTWG